MNDYQIRIGMVTKCQDGLLPREVEVEFKERITLRLLDENF
jgi:hypothetical protein